MSTDTPTTDTAATGSADAPRRGRPRQHASAAERQRAYRQRLKEQGRRVIQRVVADVRDDKPLHSDIIDLSEVRRYTSLDDSYKAMAADKAREAEAMAWCNAVAGGMADAALPYNSRPVRLHSVQS